MSTTVASAESLSAKSQRYSGGIRTFVSEWMILFLFLGLFIICAVMIDRFLDLGNLMNIARQVSFLTIAALGQFFVILIAHLDLSVGSSIGLTSVLMAGLVVKSGLPAWLAIIAVLGVAVLIGLTNGALVVYGKVPAFIATLVGMNVLMGLAYLYSRGLPISGLPSWVNYLGMGYLFSIPVPIYLMVIVAVLCYVFTMHTELGRSFYAVGGNLDASRLSGINVKFVGILGFVLCSVLATIASVGLTARTMSGGAALGEAMLFDIITVVVLGGTSLFGGKGNVVSVVIAALLIGVITNAMVLLGIDTYFQWIVKGVILIVVVLIDVNSKRA